METQLADRGFARIAYRCKLAVSHVRHQQDNRQRTVQLVTGVVGIAAVSELDECEARRLACYPDIVQGTKSREFILRMQPTVGSHASRQRCIRAGAAKQAQHHCSVIVAVLMSTTDTEIPSA